MTKIDPVPLAKDALKRANVAHATALLLHQEVGPLMSERIVAAAILDIDGKVHFISSPARHYHVLWWMRGRFDRLTDMPKPNDFEEDEQGFLTDRGRYVNRKEAAIIALHAGQVKTLHAPPNLFSEDLW